jgi:hypothetical protein
MKAKKEVRITAPNFKLGTFTIEAADGAPLVIHRFSAKTKNEMIEKQTTGKAASSKKNRAPKDAEETFNDARYISPANWDGFNASSIRAAMITACKLVGFHMTLAKLAIFVEPDGWDAKEPQIPLVRIYGDPILQQDIARVSNGNPYVTIRPAYHNWSAKVKIKWDADQFTQDDIFNLLHRVGGQVGIGEGRPNSKKGTGMGWGIFKITTGEITE